MLRLQTDNILGGSSRDVLRIVSVYKLLDVVADLDNLGKRKANVPRAPIPNLNPLVSGTNSSRRSIYP